MGLCLCNPLAQYAENFTSQGGEDGIIEHILRVLEIHQGWCVELGACDGERFSNTNRLIRQKNWSGVAIEAASDYFQKLTKYYRERSDVHCIQAIAHFEGPERLDALLKTTPIPKDFDLLSLDIDGNDLHVWEAMTAYRPKVVVIEYNPTIPNAVKFTQRRDMRIQQGNSLAALIEAGKKKGYELIATTKTNGFFVLRELFPLFGIEDNSISAMREPDDSQCYIFQLYDGTFALQGCRYPIWSESSPGKVRIKQIYPRWLRFRNSQGPMKRALRGGWMFLKRLHLVP